MSSEWTAWTLPPDIRRNPAACLQTEVLCSHRQSCSMMGLSLRPWTASPPASLWPIDEKHLALYCHILCAFPTQPHLPHSIVPVDSHPRSTCLLF